MGLRRHAASTDANQSEIVEALEAAQFAVYRMGLPVDLLVAKWGINHVCEVKLPPSPRGGTSHSALTDGQKAFFAKWKGKGCAHVVRSPQDALDQLKECYREKQAKRLPDA